MNLMLKSTFFAGLLLLSCTKEDPNPLDKEPATPSVADKYETAIVRLKRDFLENGWVVSRGEGGSPEHQGEGLLWTSLAMAALPCDEGGSLEDTLITSIRSREGALVRIEPLGEYAGGREISIDGAIGLYRGIAERVQRCNSDKWREVIALHRDYVDTHGGKLNEAAPAILLPQFKYVLDILAGDQKDQKRQRELEQLVAGWAFVTVAGHASCYRIHLGLLTLQTIDFYNHVSRAGRQEFCHSTLGTEIPTVEAWCGRGGNALRRWIDEFQYNSWEYRHQRCGKWESPDGQGLETPGLDLLVAIRDSYNI